MKLIAVIEEVLVGLTDQQRVQFKVGVFVPMMNACFMSPNDQVTKQDIDTLLVQLDLILEEQIDNPNIPEQVLEMFDEKEQSLILEDIRKQKDMFSVVRDNIETTLMNMNPDLKWAV
jgi:hypothetical protein